MTYKIWYNGSYPETETELLRSLSSGHELILASDHSKEESAKLLNDADIAFGQPNPDIVRQSATLKLIHLSSAGYDKFDNAEMRNALTSRGAALTNSSQVYNEPCAQHALAMMLCLARRLPEALEVQRTTREWPTLELRAISPLLCGQTVLMLGFGAIAQRLAELLEPFHANLIAVRRRKMDHDKVNVINEDELSNYLPLADHVVNILPSNAGTAKFVNAEKLGLMKKGAILYNIGRGTTVNQDDLLDALNSGHLGAAFLDVTDPEPLPPAHPLWTAKNCYITPHTAGGHTNEKERLIRHFGENLRRYAAHEPLIDRVI